MLRRIGFALWIGLTAVSFGAEGPDSSPTQRPTVAWIGQFSTSLAEHPKYPDAKPHEFYQWLKDKIDTIRNQLVQDGHSSEDLVLLPLSIRPSGSDRTVQFLNLMDLFIMTSLKTSSDFQVTFIYRKKPTQDRQWVGDYRASHLKQVDGIVWQPIRGIGLFLTAFEQANQELRLIHAETELSVSRLERTIHSENLLDNDKLEILDIPQKAAKDISKNLKAFVRNEIDPSRSFFNLNLELAFELDNEVIAFPLLSAPQGWVQGQYVDLYRSQWTEYLGRKRSRFLNALARLGYRAQRWCQELLGRPSRD